MGTPIFILAGQSNARRLSNEITAHLDARYGADGYVLVESYVPGAPLTRDARNKDDWFSDDELPRQLIDQTIAATRAHADGYAAGMIWIQGEADTWAVGDPGSYQARLMDLLDRVSDGVAQDATPAARSFADMNLIISELADAAPAAQTRDPWDDIIAQQQNTARDSDLVVSVDPDALAQGGGLGQGAMFDDALHYSGRFSDMLAHALVAAAVDMIDTAPAAPPEVQAPPPAPPLAPLPQAAAPPSHWDSHWDADDGIFRGTANGEQIAGSNADDTIRGAGGQDMLDGKAGNDRITGGHQNDTILGGTGRDHLNGQGGNDSLQGGDGRDNLAGGRGDDLLQGDGGADRLTGNHGDDALWGGNGNDRLFGGVDDDTLSGGDGRDRVVGGTGRDVLEGGRGDDLLFGGVGNGKGDNDQDIFIFRSFADGGGGQDRILDFELALDRLDLRSFNVDDVLQDVLSRAQSVNKGQDTRIDFDNGDTLQLDNVTLQDLTLEHFLT